MSQHVEFSVTLTTTCTLTSVIDRNKIISFCTVRSLFLTTNLDGVPNDLIKK